MDNNFPFDQTEQPGAVPFPNPPATPPTTQEPKSADGYTYKNLDRIVLHKEE